MDFGKVEYYLTETSKGKGGSRACVRLTLIGQGDKEFLCTEGLAGLRRRRIQRLTKEAELQGCLLSYEDLSALLLASLATIKRDVVNLDMKGERISLKRRRKNGNGNNGVGRQ